MNHDEIALRILTSLITGRDIASLTTDIIKHAHELASLFEESLHNKENITETSEEFQRRVASGAAEAMRQRNLLREGSL